MNVPDRRIRLAAVAAIALTCRAADREPHFRVQEINLGRAATSVSVLDLNDDGKPDIFAGGEKQAWLQNPSWSVRPMPGGPGVPQGESGAPQFGWINGIRRLAVAEAGGIATWRQPTQPLDAQRNTKPRPTAISDGAWSRELVAANAGTGPMVWADFDGDGSDELAISSASGIVIFKRTSEARWQKIAVDRKPASSLAAADLNGDGLAELIAGSTTGLRIYWNEFQRTWVRHVISSGFRTQSAIAADFTGRGRKDVISGDIENDKKIYLHSAPDWKPTLLYSGIRLIQSAAMDVDGDGDLDFIGAQYRPGLIFWLEHPKDPLHDPWPFHLIDDFTMGGVNGVHGLLTADIDRDGRIDLAANSDWMDGQFPNSLAWFSVPPSPRTAARWDRHIFADRDAPGQSHYLGAGDVNGDGRLDIATGAKIGPDGNWFAWWEQPADARAPWKKHLIAQGQEGATNILIADVNGDGKPDFFASRGHGKGLVWYEAPHWTPHEIYSDLVGPHSLAAGDIDGDGDIDFVTCAKDARICAWFENDGKGHFTIHPIHQDQASYEIRLVDIDGDGDLDLLVAGQESQNVVWFENMLLR